MNTATPESLVVTASRLRGDSAAQALALLRVVPGLDAERLDEEIERQYAPDAPPPQAPMIVLPSGYVSISECARVLFSLLAPNREFFFRAGRVMELRKDTAADLRLAPVEPDAFRSRIEKLGLVFKWISHKDGEALKPSHCSTDTARALLTTREAGDILPHVNAVCAAPVIVEQDGKARVLKQGYHPERGGLFIMGGGAVDVPIGEAVTDLRGLLVDYDFTTAGDEARALASFLTPALRLGGFITDCIPLDISEADHSQAGKTLRQKAVAAVYRESPYIIAQRQGGVGSADESFCQALVAGKPFIQLDNLRGRLDSQFMEAFLTAGGPIGARIPHNGEMQIDSRFFVVLATSNGVETTRDLANRASIVRIRKRSMNYPFKQYPEGGLLEHARAHQAHYLGCVFAVVREWLRQGKPKTTETRHDFREWAQALDAIVQNIFHAAPLMDGHMAAQERVSNSALTWLRAVGLAVAENQELDVGFNASRLGELCEEHGIEIPGLRDSGDDAARARQIGVLMRRVFRESDEIELDSFAVRRVQTEADRPGGEGGSYRVRAYIFGEKPEMRNPASAVSRSKTPIDYGKDDFSGTIVPLTAPTAGLRDTEPPTPDPDAQEELAFLEDERAAIGSFHGV